jgi:hypothetical protein
MKVAACVGISAAAMFSFLASAQDAGEFSLPPEIQEKVVAHAKTERQLQPLGSYAMVLEVDNKANFNKVYVDARRNLVRLENGLIGIVGSSALRNGKSQGSGRELSLCGFIALLTESGSTSDTSTTTAIPIGKQFVQFGMKSAVDFSRRFRLVSFDTSVPSVCNPVPGSEFTYKAETEYTIKTVSQFLGTRTSSGRRTDAGTCRVSNEVEPAAKINPALQGEALTVTCETETGAGRKDSTKRVFLREAGLYLTTEQMEGGMQHTFYQYSDVSYLKPD